VVVGGGDDVEGDVRESAYRLRRPYGARATERPLVLTYNATERTQSVSITAENSLAEAIALILEDRREDGLPGGAAGRRA
jgi:hypothetical protein